MLCRNDNRVYTNRFAVVVFNRDLRLSVGTKIRQCAVLPYLGKFFRKFMRVINRHGHKRRRFVAGIAEYHALVSRTVAVNAHSYVGRLFIYCGHNGTGVAVNAVIRIGITDVAQNAAGYTRNVDIIRMGRYLAHNKNHTRRRTRFAGNAGVRVV